MCVCDLILKSFCDHDHRAHTHSFLDIIPRLFSSVSHTVLPHKHTQHTSFFLTHSPDPSCSSTHKHIHTHAHTHMHTHTHIHTHMHTHIPLFDSSSFSLSVALCVCVCVCCALCVVKIWRDVWKIYSCCCCMLSSDGSRVEGRYTLSHTHPLTHTLRTHNVFHTLCLSTLNHTHKHTPLAGASSKCGSRRHLVWPREEKKSNFHT